jgi:hypothetical protein
MINDEIKKAIESNRAQKFEVEIKRTSQNTGSDEFDLRFTKNGYQWTAVTLNLTEAQQIVDALKDHLEKNSTLNYIK